MRVFARADDRRDEVGTGGGGDEGLGPVDDVVVTLTHRASAHSCDIAAGVRLGDGERPDQLTGERGLGVAVDQVAVTARDQMRQRDAVREQRREQAARCPGVEQLLGDGRRVDGVAALATCVLGKRDAEQSCCGGLGVQLARQFAGTLPLVEVRADLGLGEPPDCRAQRLPLRRRPRVCCHSAVPSTSATGMFTCRDRSRSPRPFACGSCRVPAATPSPSRPCTTKFSARMFRSSKRSTSYSLVSGSSSLNFSTVSPRASHWYAASVSTQTPTLALPPLSPLRAPATVPSGARIIARCWPGWSRCPAFRMKVLPLDVATSELGCGSMTS